MLIMNVTCSGLQKEETMSISLNPVVGFKSTKLQTKYHHVSRPNSRIQINGRRRGSFVSAVDNDRLVTDAIIKGHGGAESSIFDNQLPAMNSSIEDSPVGNNVGEESGPQTSGASNSSTISADMKSRPKRSPLTARERLKAARVIRRRIESKTSKSEMGRKVLDALRESDKGKKILAFQKPLKTCLMTASEGCQRRDGPFNFQGVQNSFSLSFHLF